MRKLNLWNRSKPSQISQIYGMLIALGLIIYFVLAHVIGFVHINELRLLNLVVMMVGVYFALKQFRRTHEGHINYFRALALGTATGAIATVTFALFIFLFLQIDENLMQSIKQNEPFGRYLNPYIASFAILLEGILSGFAVTYVLINYFETDKATLPQGGELPHWRPH